MSDEIYEMLQDEAQNRISTSPASNQKYNVFVLKKSLNVWILGYSARGVAAIQFGQMTELSELFNGFDVETLEGATPEITFPEDDEMIQKGSQISNTIIEEFALEDTVVALDNVF